MLGRKLTQLQYLKCDGRGINPVDLVVTPGKTSSTLHLKDPYEKIQRTTLLSLNTPLPPNFSKFTTILYRICYSNKIKDTGKSFTILRDIHYGRKRVHYILFS